ncbi:MAG: branched-chain amino acid ABC transporter permease [Desulfurococcaceae archaeon]|nr:MAG: branched-chain amino acid ABC transporter permease [Desulfurococcaceae archaeon]
MVRGDDPVRMKLRDPLVYIIILLLISLLVIPITRDPFYLYLSSLFMILSIFSLSYNILFGYAGLLSFGHALFYAAGAYSLALFTMNVLRDPFIGVLVALATSTILAIAVGALTLRHSKIYFAMLTLAFGMLLYALLIKWRSVTGGSDGIAGIPRSGFIVNIMDPVARYYFIYGAFALILILLYLFHRSRYGLLIRGLGVNEDFMPYTGHSVYRLRMIAFIISGSVAGVAGALYALLMGVITPDLAYWTTSAEPLVATLIGGSKFFAGPILGSLIFIVITTLVARIADIWQLMLGLILASLILGSRGGIAEVVERIWRAGRSSGLRV